MLAGKPLLLLSCEHASQFIPKKLLLAMDGVLPHFGTHRAVDLHAKDLFRNLEKRLRPHCAKSGNCSRLLVDLNRSIGHPNLFSEFSKKLSKEQQDWVLDQYYYPFRNSFQKTIDVFLRKKAGSPKRIIHLSIHSFTPVLNGIERNCDLAFLYDPSRSIELHLVKAWQQELSCQAPYLRIRRNYPYKGKSDGFTTQLRKLYGSYYGGIELEFNQNALGYLGVASIAKILANTLGVVLPKIAGTA